MNPTAVIAFCVGLLFGALALAVWWRGLIAKPEQVLLGICVSQAIRSAQGQPLLRQP